MKKKIRKTGEIVDVIVYCAPLNEIRADGDWVSYIDSGGFEHHCCTGLNIYWDFEDVEEELAKEINWEERRFNLASKLLVERLSCTEWEEEEIDSSIRFAILGADALISELKKGGEK